MCSSAKWIMLLCRGCVLMITGHLAVAQHLVEQRQRAIRQVVTKFANLPPLDFCMLVVWQFGVFGCCELFFRTDGMWCYVDAFSSSDLNSNFWVHVYPIVGQTQFPFFGLIQYCQLGSPYRPVPRQGATLTKLNSTERRLCRPERSRFICEGFSVYGTDENLMAFYIKIRAKLRGILKATLCLSNASLQPLLRARWRAARVMLRLCSCCVQPEQIWKRKMMMVKPV